MTLLQHAIAYASSGLRVFALRARRKEPATRNGCKDGTTAPKALQAMWKALPTANIGIATGSESGVLVLDVDGDPGMATLAEWQALHGELPPTPTVKTGDGLHFYFRYPGDQVQIRNSASKAASGIDVRTDGGYVVAPPSVHPNGTVYEWLSGKSPADQPFAYAPGWLIAKLADKPRAPAPEFAPTRDHVGHTKYGQRALDAECMELSRAHEGGRNQGLNALAFRIGQLVSAGHLGQHAALADAKRAALACGLHASEADKTIASGFAAGLKSPNPGDPRPDAPRTRQSGTPHGNEQAPGHDGEATQPADTVEPKEIYTAPEVAELALYHLTDETRAELPRSGFDRLDSALGGFPPGSMFTIGGRTGAGKSSLMLSMAMHQSFQQGLKVGIVSCEDAEWIWGTRLIAAIGDVNTRLFVRGIPRQSDGTFSEEVYRMIGSATQAVETAKQYGLHFAFPIAKPIQHVTRAVTRLVKEHGCNVIMVDYLQAIAAKGQDRYIARTDAAQELKSLAHDLGVSLVLGSQLKRTESGGNAFRDPTNNELKDSGDIENMSEAIILLWPTSDQENAPVLGKVTKVKWSDARPRFAICRNPTSGAIVSLVEPPMQHSTRNNSYDDKGF